MSKNEKLILSDEKGKPFEVRPSTLIVFLDETGEETFSDPNAPIFGFGGLIVEGRNYFKQVEIPWHEIKNKYFEGIDIPLHAADLRNPSNEIIGAFNSFFTTYNFGRFGVTCTDKTIININEKIENIIAAVLLERIKDVANKMNWYDMLIIYEENQRLLNSLKQELMTKTPKNKKGEPIDVSYYTILKDPSFAGMEVADFIIHTAGRQGRLMRDNHFNKEFNEKLPDFENVFSGNDFSSYMSLSRVSRKPKK